MLSRFPLIGHLILISSGILVFVASNSDVQGQGLIPTPPQEYSALPKYSATRFAEVIYDEANGVKTAKTVPVEGPLPDLPPVIDLSMFAPDPGRQQFNDCVAWSVAYASLTIQHAQTRSLGKPTDAVEISSPRFIYTQINGGSNTGTYIYRNSGSSAISLIRDKGCASEATAPYDSSSAGYTNLPAERAMREGVNYKIASHTKCDSVDDIRYALVFGVPVVIACHLDSQFSSFSGSNNYHWNGDKSGGNHAMCIIGYDNQRSAFLVQNSWGMNWGNSGRFWASYQEFLKLGTSDSDNGWCYEAHAIVADTSRRTQFRVTKSPHRSFLFVPDGSLLEQGTLLVGKGGLRAAESTDLFLYGITDDGTILGFADQQFDISSPDFPAGLGGGKARMIATSGKFLYVITRNGNVLGRIPKQLSPTGESHWEEINLGDGKIPVDIRFREGDVYLATSNGDVYKRIVGNGWILQN